MKEIASEMSEPRILLPDQDRAWREWHKKAHRCLFPEEQRVAYCRNRELRRYTDRLFSYANIAVLFAFFVILALAASNGYFELLTPMFKSVFLGLMKSAVDALGVGSQGSWLGAVVHFLSTGVVAACTGAALFGAVAVGTVRQAAQLPTTEIGISAAGVWLLYRIRERNVELMVVKHLPWKKLKAISLSQAKGKRSVKDREICFVSNKKVELKVKLSDIVDEADRFRLIEMIRRACPEIIAPAVIEALKLPPTQASYTELWLKELAAPCRRNLKPLAPDAGLQNGKYRVRSQLGGGGQATVYLAAADDGETLVALKEFILPVFPDPEVRKKAALRFDDESRMLAALDHPQIVKLLDVFVEDHRAYLVLERAEGVSLRKHIRSNGPVNETMARQLGLQICEMLSYLHGRNPPIVHRDIAPDNLILQDGGRLKLIDFSVAQQADTLVTGTTVGKHNYMPPEQVRGKPVTQSDIYALGATLFFLLAGDEPEPISSLHPKAVRGDVTERLDAVIARATEPELDARYKTIEEVADDLGESQV